MVSLGSKLKKAKNKDNYISMFWLIVHKIVVHETEVQLFCFMYYYFKIQ